MLDIVREMPCDEDFKPWDTNARKDFLSKGYHTRARAKREQTVSLKECIEDGDSGNLPNGRNGVKRRTGR